MEKAVRKESIRVQAEYERRKIEVRDDLYAPWQPGEMLMTSERKRIAASMLKQLGKFPDPGSRCLEVGYGKLGWLPDLLSWGLLETDLYGIELDAERAGQARRAFPSAHLEIGDATDLPWEDNYFDFAVVSTVFSSILDVDVRKMISNEVARVIAPSGVVVLYDIVVNNPRNKNLRPLKHKDVIAMFPAFHERFQSLTLAPPIARMVAGRSWTLATMLSALPFLRTHFLAILEKR
ncbi:MAG: class I SAM-dependent methyltransferase [Pyrinomonadaceae bacterium]